MGNSLKEKLEGKTVVLREDAMAPQYRDLKYRLFDVEGGFGAHPGTIGTALFGVFRSDGARARMEGHDVERIATDEDINQTA